MKGWRLTVGILLLPALLYAVGTKRKKQKVHVRREFVPFTQAEAPVEFHSANDTFHSLRCKGTGIERCKWTREPRVGDGVFSLEIIDKWVVAMVCHSLGSSREAGSMEFNEHLTVRYQRLPGGYEYIIEETTPNLVGKEFLSAEPVKWEIDQPNGGDAQNPKR